MRITEEIGRVQQEEGMAQMGKWKAWVEGLGEKVVNPGRPLPDSKIVTATSVKNDDDPNAMKGFAVVQAESMDAGCWKSPNQIRS